MKICEGVNLIDEKSSVGFGSLSTEGSGSDAYELKTAAKSGTILSAHSPSVCVITVDEGRKARVQGGVSSDSNPRKTHGFYVDGVRLGSTISSKRNVGFVELGQGKHKLEITAFANANGHSYWRFLEDSPRPKKKILVVASVAPDEKEKTATWLAENGNVFDKAKLDGVIDDFEIVCSEGDKTEDYSRSITTNVLVEAFEEKFGEGIVVATGVDRYFNEALVKEIVASVDDYDCLATRCNDAFSYRSVAVVPTERIGAVAVSYADWKRLGGFDERFVGAGYEIENFLARFAQSGIVSETRNDLLRVVERRKRTATAVSEINEKLRGDLSWNAESAERNSTRWKYYPTVEKKEVVQEQSSVVEEVKTEPQVEPETLASEEEPERASTVAAKSAKVKKSRKRNIKKEK